MNRADPNGFAWQADEQAFVCQLAAGDILAYRELLERYWQPLVGYAYRMLASQDAAEDAVQEAFIRLWQGRSQFSPNRSLRGYLFGVTRNVVSDELRRVSVRRAALARGSLPAPTPPTPADTTELGELEAAAARAIEALPERRREVFELAHFSGLSHKEIGEVLGMAASTAKKHMNLALHDLRSALQPYVEQRLETLRA